MLGNVPRTCSKVWDINYFKGSANNFRMELFTPVKLTFISTQHPKLNLFSSEIKQYPAALDTTLQVKKRKHSEAEGPIEEKKVKIEQSDVSVDLDTLAIGMFLSITHLQKIIIVILASPKKKKKKQKNLDESQEAPETPVATPKKKKKKSGDETIKTEDDVSQLDVSTETKKKKKKAKLAEEASEAVSELDTTQDDGGKKKKKKKKKLEDADETITTASELDTTQDSGPSAKKKKKKNKE